MTAHGHLVSRRRAWIAAAQAASPGQARFGPVWGYMKGVLAPGDATAKSVDKGVNEATIQVP